MPSIHGLSRPTRPTTHAATPAQIKRHLMQLEDSGISKTTTFGKLPVSVQASVKAGVDAAKKAALKQDAQASFGTPEFKAIYERAGSKPSKLVGFTVELPIYANEHDVDRRLYFAADGRKVGNEYVGE